MYEVNDGPLPDGVKIRASYPFATMKVGEWFFAPGKKLTSVRVAFFNYRRKVGNKDLKASCIAATVNGVEGTLCQRTA